MMGKSLATGSWLPIPTFHQTLTKPFHPRHVQVIGLTHPALTVV